MAPDSPDTRREAATAALTAAILGQGQRLDLLSMALTVLALAALLLAAPAPAVLLLLAAGVAAGLVQRYFAFRCDLDARLFAHWAACWSDTWNPDPQADLSAFDRALTGALGTPAALARPLADRVAGALRLFRLQFVALLVQFATLLAAVLVRLL